MYIGGRLRAVYLSIPENRTPRRERKSMRTYANGDSSAGTPKSPNPPSRTDAIAYDRASKAGPLKSFPLCASPSLRLCVNPVSRHPKNVVPPQNSPRTESAFDNQLLSPSNERSPSEVLQSFAEFHRSFGE